MRRYAQLVDALEVGVRGCVQAVEKEVVDPAATKLAGRQTDVVDNQQVDRATHRPLVLVRGVALPRLRQQHPVSGHSCF